MSSYLWSWVDAISPSPFNIHPPLPTSLILRGLKMRSLGVVLACLLLFVSAFILIDVFWACFLTIIWEEILSHSCFKHSPSFVLICGFLVLPLYRCYSLSCLLILCSLCVSVWIPLRHSCLGCFPLQCLVHRMAAHQRHSSLLLRCQSLAFHAGCRPYLLD